MDNTDPSKDNRKSIFGNIPRPGRRNTAATPRYIPKKPLPFHNELQAVVKATDSDLQPEITETVDNYSFAGLCKSEENQEEKSLEQSTVRVKRKKFNITSS